MEENITPHIFKVCVDARRKLNNHNSFLLWFTGLSGSGKSTIANLVEKELNKRQIRTYVLDGDNVRKGINNDLTFTPKDRNENIRRVAEISNLMIDAGIVTLASFVSPYKSDRENIKNIVGQDNILEIYVNTSVEECERRDVKGLYKKARAGEIKNMTGISSPYEEPDNPDIQINTEYETIEKAVEKIIQIIVPKLEI